MCVSTPKMETPSAPPRTESVEAESNKAAARAALVRRRQAMLSRSDAMAGGQQQGKGKVKLGE